MMCEGLNSAPQQVVTVEVATRGLNFDKNSRIMHFGSFWYVWFLMAFVSNNHHFCTNDGQDSHTRFWYASRNPVQNSGSPFMH